MEHLKQNSSGLKKIVVLYFLYNPVEIFGRNPHVPYPKLKYSHNRFKAF